MQVLSGGRQLIMDLKIFKSSAGLYAFINLLQQISDPTRGILSYLLNHWFPHLLMSQIDFDMCLFGCLYES